MKIDQIILYQLSLPLRAAFITSFGSIIDRQPILIEIRSDGVSGWGEAAALPLPFYNHEDSNTALYILKTYLCPLVLETQPQNIESMNAVLGKVVGNNCAKAGLEMAFWDLVAKQKGVALYKLLGGTRSSILAGVSLPLSEDAVKLTEDVGNYLEQGYQRIKLKIAPTNDIASVEALRASYPDANLMLDANAAYSLADKELFKKLDSLNLMMIEQPLDAKDLLAHAELQSMIATPICLDESINNRADAMVALKLGSCKVINIKPARVGGLQEAKAIHELALQAGIGVWCGGMLETGIGRCHALASATLANYVFPADLSESARYFDQDIVEPAISFSKPGVIELSDRPGIGVEVSLLEIEKRIKFKQCF